MKLRVNHLFIASLSVLLPLIACNNGEGSGEKNTITVAITSPQDQTYQTGQLGVEVAVTGEISRVEFLVDDVLAGTVESAPFTFTWDTAAVSEALHRIKAVAHGPDNAVAISNERLVVVDRTLPAAAFHGLELPYVFGGQTTLTLRGSDDNELAELRLFLDGTLLGSCTAPSCPIDWDTTTLADGPVALTLEAEDSAGNVETVLRAAYVVNDGTVISYDDGSGIGLYSIPETWESVDLHYKYHWTMPSGITELTAVLQWTNPEWQMEAALGIGTCPHSGVSHATGEGYGGQVVVTLPADEMTPSLAEFVGGDLWFVHAGHGPDMADLDPFIGESSYFSVTTLMY